MILKLTGLICTRYAVEQIAAQHPDVVEVDLSAAEVVGGSTMHQLMLSFPDATLTGLEGFNKDLYDWVFEAVNSDTFKRNQKRPGED